MTFGATEYWMFGIMAMMCLFGVCAGVFSSLRKKK